MRENLGAVAFDLDGTLYPNYRLYLRLIPFVLKEQRLLRALGRARTMLRTEQKQSAGAADFYQAQSAYMAAMLKKNPLLVQEKTETLIYRGWEALFKKIRLYPHVAAVLGEFKKAGLKLGLLSDFPAERKLAYLGLDGCFDAALCSEHSGCLKPDAPPFRALAEKLGEKTERILYVGNCVSYDIIGAKRAGMKAALIRSPVFFWKRKTGNADFVFFDYRTLRNYVLS
jgi:putative hydrolase of the HAD superfamily